MAAHTISASFCTVSGLIICFHSLFFLVRVWIRCRERRRHLPSVLKPNVRCCLRLPPQITGTAAGICARRIRKMHAIKNFTYFAQTTVYIHFLGRFTWGHLAHPQKQSYSSQALSLKAIKRILINILTMISHAKMRGRERCKTYTERNGAGHTEITGDSGGATGIRTLETVSRLHTFQACAFDHSATAP